MRRPFVAAALAPLLLALLLAACGDGGPTDGSLLVGRWGVTEPPVQLTVTPAGTTLLAACARFTSNRPLRLAADSTFSLTGEYQSSLGQLRPWAGTLTGRARGAELDVSLSVPEAEGMDVQPPPPVTLRPDITPTSFLDQGEVCPQ